mgnify:CR=1 FL=1
MSEIKEWEKGPAAAPSPVTPSGPTPEEQSREREAQAVAAKQAAEIEAARAQAKAETMERFVQESFARGRSTPPPQEAISAQETLGLTDEQILTDPAWAIAKLQEQIRLERAARADYQERANSVIGNLAKNSFKSEMGAISKERFGEWLVPHVEDYFRKNPEEAFKDGSVRRIYNELVGQNIEELERLHKDKVALPNQQRERVVEMPIGYSTMPEPPRKEGNQLPEDEAFMLASHNAKSPQYAMTPEEWLEIRTGKKFPKKISTDIQHRGAKPNVSY